jgi:hypothetical protein
MGNSRTQAGEDEESLNTSLYQKARIWLKNHGEASEGARLKLPTGQTWHSLSIKEWGKPGAVVHAYNPSTLEAEAGGPWVWGQPGLYNKIQSQKNKKKNKPYIDL